MEHACKQHNRLLDRLKRGRSVTHRHNTCVHTKRHELGISGTQELSLPRNALSEETVTERESQLVLKRSMSAIARKCD